jgi:hypothetical protein
MRRAAISVLVFAVSAQAGPGAILGQTALGVVGAGVGVIPGVIAGAVGNNEAVGGGLAGVTGGFFCAGGVYLAGEWWDGPSADRSHSFLGSLAGGMAGGTAAAVCFGLAGRDDGHTDKNESTWIPVGLLVLFAGTPALAITGYYTFKDPASSEGSSRAPTVTPAIAALPARGGEKNPTLTFGFAASF